MHEGEGSLCLPASRICFTMVFYMMCEKHLMMKMREAANLSLAASRSLGAAEHTFAPTSSNGTEMVVTRNQPQVANQR